MKKKKLINGLIELGLWVCALVVIVPMLFVLINAVKSPAETMSSLNLNLPEEVHFENFVEVIKSGGVIRSFLNSILYSTASCTLTCILASMASFIIMRRNTKFNRVIFIIFLLGMIAPGNTVTTYRFMKALKLVNTYHGLILLYVAGYLPASIFLYNGFIKNLPRELDEAARIDGASPLQLFFRVIFPLLKPVTVTVFILNFVGCWNDFMYPLYFLSKSEQWTVVLLLYQYIGQYTTQKNMLFAAAAIVIVPAVIVYLLGQKYIIDGMTAGSVKG